MLSVAAVPTLVAKLPAGGLYVVLLQLDDAMSLQVGALGTFALPAGSYAYVGTARRGLVKRVARHLAPSKCLRWHFDYLSSCPAARPVGALVTPLSSLSECALNQQVALAMKGAAPIPRFGASDCRQGCEAHLWFARQLSLRALSHQLQRRIDRPLFVIEAATLLA